MTELLHVVPHEPSDAVPFERPAQWSGYAAVEARRAAPLPEWTLDQIGAENEEIKSRCIDLVQKIDELTKVKETFVEISNWVGHILAAREETNAALVERGMMIAMTEGSLADLKEENRVLYEGREEARAENSLLASENDRLRAIVQLNEGRIEKLEAELHEARDVGQSFSDAYEAERAQAYHLRGELEDLQGVVANNDALITELQGDLAAARDEAVFLSQRADMLQGNLTESQSEAGKLQGELSQSLIHAGDLSEKIRELEIALDAERQQIAKTEELVAANHAEHQQAQTAWRAEQDQYRRSIAELETKLQEQTARAQAADSLLVDVRSQLQQKLNQCRLGERQAAELEQKLLRISEHAESVAGDALQSKEKLEARDRAHARLSKRARALIRAMRDLASRLEKSEQKAALVGERLNAETGRFTDHKAQLEQAIRELTEQLEKERAASQVTAGALEAARQRHQIRDDEQREESGKVIDILARAEKTHLLAEQAAPPVQAPKRA
jgi:chromosome segregation ATPase